MACGRNDKPDPPEGVADVPLFVVLYKDRITLYRDLSGDSLHRWVGAGHWGCPLLVRVMFMFV